MRPQHRARFLTPQTHRVGEVDLEFGSIIARRRAAPVSRATKTGLPLDGSIGVIPGAAATGRGSTNSIVNRRRCRPVS
jgi:hypothetical protein